MIRLDRTLATEARRQAVLGSVRLFAAGPYAAYLAGKVDDAGPVRDVFVVGPAWACKEFETELAGQYRVTRLKRDFDNSLLILPGAKDDPTYRYASFRTLEQALNTHSIQALDLVSGVTFESHWGEAAAFDVWADGKKTTQRFSVDPDETVLDADYELPRWAAKNLTGKGLNVELKDKDGRVLAAIRADGKDEPKPEPRRIKATWRFYMQPSSVQFDFPDGSTDDAVLAAVLDNAQKTQDGVQLITYAPPRIFVAPTGGNGFDNRSLIYPSTVYGVHSGGQSVSVEYPKAWPTSGKFFQRTMAKSVGAAPGAGVEAREVGAKSGLYFTA